jgi:hypothetical protein
VVPGEQFEPGVFLGRLSHGIGRNVAICYVLQGEVGALQFELANCDSGGLL